MKAGMMMVEMISRWDRNEVADRLVMYNEVMRAGNLAFNNTTRIHIRR